MHATAIPQHESTFKSTGVDSNGKHFVLKPSQWTVPGGQEQLEVTSCTLESGDTSFYYPEEVKKDRIALHFTAGFLKGDLATLTQPGNHVSVAFIVARDGSLYNLWDPK